MAWAGTAGAPSRGLLLLMSVAPSQGCSHHLLLHAGRQKTDVGAGAGEPRGKGKAD